MDKSNEGNKQDSTQPRALQLITSEDLQRVISNVIIERKLSKVHFLKAEPFPIKVIKFNLSGMTLETLFTKACGQGVVDVAHAVDPKTDPPKMPMVEYKAWKESTGGVYEVFLSNASKRPRVITKETILSDLQAAKAAAIATGMTEEEIEKVVEDAELVEQILAEKEHYYVTSQGKRSIWADCYSLYNSVIDVTKNPFLANLFIPKIHEAVELLAAFLVGANQSISAEGEGIGDAKKAQVAEKFLDFQWRKVIKARPKIITWVKQAILFGDGIMKLGWEVDADLKEGKVFMEPVSLPDIYMDYYAKHIQDSSSVIHRMVINLDDIIADDRYNDNKHSLITLENSQEENQDTTFGSDDDTVQASTSAIKKVELLERWTDDELITIAGTGSDFQIIRREDNKLGQKPFVKVPFKTSPLPNRAYNIGSVEPQSAAMRSSTTRSRKAPCSFDCVEMPYSSYFGTSTTTTLAASGSITRKLSTKSLLSTTLIRPAAIKPSINSMICSIVASSYIVCSFNQASLAVCQRVCH